jgi:hypothetical protein
MRQSFDTEGDEDDYVNYVRLPCNNRSDLTLIQGRHRSRFRKIKTIKLGNRLNDRRSIYVTVFANGILTFFFFVCFSLTQQHFLEFDFKIHFY